MATASGESWEFIAAAGLYSYLGWPEAWLARRQGEVALLMGMCALFRADERVLLDLDLRPLLGISPPVLGPRSIEVERVRRGAAPPSGQRVAVFDWPRAGGMSLTRAGRILRNGRFGAAAAMEIAARLCQRQHRWPGAPCNYRSAIVFTDGQVRFAPVLPATVARAMPSWTGSEYLEDLGLPFVREGWPDDAVATWIVASSLYELATGIGAPAVDAKRGMARRSTGTQHPLPGSVDPRLKGLDELVLRGLEGHVTLEAYARELDLLAGAHSGALQVAEEVATAFAIDQDSRWSSW